MNSYFSTVPYLKGFEIAVKESKPLSAMSSYNLLNGEHTAGRFDLLTEVLRNEWGFDGFVMSDWGTTGSGDVNPVQSEKYGYADTAMCIKAGNDLIMPGSQADVDRILDSLHSEEENSLTLEELRRAAFRIIRVIMKSSRERGFQYEK